MTEFHEVANKTIRKLTIFDEDAKTSEIVIEFRMERSLQLPSRQRQRFKPR